MVDNEILNTVINIRKKITNVIVNISGFEGTIEELTKEDAELILSIQSLVIEIFDNKNNKSFIIDNIQEYISTSIYVNITTGQIPYYETFDSFLNGNLYEINESIFYIHDIDFLEGKNQENKSYRNYKSNIELIDILRLVSDYEKNEAGELELFFYKSNNGNTLKINYKASDLRSISSENIEELKKQFIEKVDSQERKEIFKYELITILNTNNDYSFVLNNCDKLLNNYAKSFELYLTGFSFEKITTASNEYFHNLSDRIQQTIGKVSNYIFAIPIAYIFLLKYFDFEGGNYLGDLLLLIIGFLFLILIWLVPFQNIIDSITNITNDIKDFKIKIKDVKALENVVEKLQNFEFRDLKKQRTKLNIAKSISVIIFLIVLGAFIYIYHSIDIMNIIKYLKSNS